MQNLNSPRDPAAHRRAWIPAALLPLLLASPATAAIPFNDGFECGSTGRWGGGSFQIQGPQVPVQPGQEIAYCFYFRSPNTSPLGIRQWSSTTAGDVATMHDLEVFFTRDINGQPLDFKPPGTLSSFCDAPGGADRPEWMYDANEPTAALAMPETDGAAHPLAMELVASTAGYVRTHFRNQTADVVNVGVTVTADTLRPSVPYTRTAVYQTYNGNLSIPPNAVNFEEHFECDAPPGAKFWRFSMHTHKQAILTNILDGLFSGLPLVFHSADWQHPGASIYGPPHNFYVFTNPLGYSCTYNNLGDNSGRTLHTGDSDPNDEQCVAISYYFPVTPHPAFCYNNVEVF